MSKTRTGHAKGLRWVVRVNLVGQVARAQAQVEHAAIGGASVKHLRRLWRAEKRAHVVHRRVGRRARRLLLGQWLPVWPVQGKPVVDLGRTLHRDVHRDVVVVVAAHGLVALDRPIQGVRVERVERETRPVSVRVERIAREARVRARARQVAGQHAVQRVARTCQVHDVVSHLERVAVAAGQQAVQRVHAQDRVDRQVPIGSAVVHTHARKVALHEDLLKKRCTSEHRWPLPGTGKRRRAAWVVLPTRFCRIVCRSKRSAKEVSVTPVPAPSWVSGTGWAPLWVSQRVDVRKGAPSQGDPRQAGGRCLQLGFPPTPHFSGGAQRRACSRSRRGRRAAVCGCVRSCMVRVNGSHQVPRPEPTRLN